MDTNSSATPESTIREIGHALHASAARSPPAFFRARGITGALLAQALRDEALHRALFQFVDVLPQLEDSQAIARHFRAYLEGHTLGGPWGRLLKLGAHAPMAWAVRASVVRIARLFLVEERERAVSVY